VPPLVVTVTATGAPAVPGGVTAVRCVSDITVTAARPPPTVTITPPGVLNPLPVIVMHCPPAAGPLAGVRPLSVGATAW
jgi:hypothetical protein